MARIERDLIVGEILRGLADDTADNLTLAVERGLDEELGGLDVDGKGEVDRPSRRRLPIAQQHTAALGRLARKLSLADDRYLRSLLDLVRDEAGCVEAMRIIDRAKCRAVA